MLTNPEPEIGPCPRRGCGYQDGVLFVLGNKAGNRARRFAASGRGHSPGGNTVGYLQTVYTADTA